MDEEVQNYMENIAKRDNTEVSATIISLLSGASALNYMQHGNPFKITKEMLGDPKYFDKLFMEWHEKQMKQNG